MRRTATSNIFLDIVRIALFYAVPFQKGTLGKPFDAKLTRTWLLAHTHTRTLTLALELT
jgi:hypothetical protein